MKRIMLSLVLFLAASSTMAATPPGKNEMLLVIPAESVVLWTPQPNNGDIFGICVDKSTRKIVDRATETSCPSSAFAADLLEGAKAVRNNVGGVTQAIPYFKDISDALPSKLLLVVYLSPFR